VARQIGEGGVETFRGAAGRYRRALMPSSGIPSRASARLRITSEIIRSRRAANRWGLRDAQTWPASPASSRPTTVAQPEQARTMAGSGMLGSVTRSPPWPSASFQRRRGRLVSTPSAQPREHQRQRRAPEEAQREGDDDADDGVACLQGHPCAGRCAEMAAIIAPLFTTQVLRRCALRSGISAGPAPRPFGLAPPASRPR
jgi:hypothetical protein